MKPSTLFRVIVTAPLWAPMLYGGLALAIAGAWIFAGRAGVASVLRCSYPNPKEGGLWS